MPNGSARRSLLPSPKKPVSRRQGCPVTRQSGRWKGALHWWGRRFSWARLSRRRQPAAAGLQAAPRRGRQVETCRDHHGGAQAVDHPQRRAAGQQTMARCRKGAGSCQTLDLMASQRSAAAGQVNVASRAGGSAQTLALTRPAGAGNTSIKRSPLPRKSVVERKEARGSIASQAFRKANAMEAGD